MLVIVLRCQRGIVQRNLRSARKRGRALRKIVHLRLAEQRELGGVGRHRGSGRGLRRGGRNQRAVGPADTGGRLVERVQNGAEKSAALRAENFGFGDRNRVAFELNIQVILDGQSERVRERKIQIAGADQIAHAHRVVEVDVGHMLFHIAIAERGLDSAPSRRRNGLRHDRLRMGRNGTGEGNRGNGRSRVSGGRRLRRGMGGRWRGVVGIGRRRLRHIGRRCLGHGPHRHGQQKHPSDGLTKNISMDTPTHDTLAHDQKSLEHAHILRTARCLDASRPRSYLLHGRGLNP